ncbi:MAG TPA: multiheme c-type cytochrome, partial [Bacteroidales bacterium]|nr:multiheme c-type cytochrome [Bacteroidales bacterium]
MQPGKVLTVFAIVSLAGFALAMISFRPALPDDKKGAFEYKDFEKSAKCRTCHVQFYEQWRQSMMSQAYTHHWDEIEYFDLAVAHAAKVPELKDVVDGCNGCHAPLAFAAGVLPPARPSENT